MSVDRADSTTDHETDPLLRVAHRLEYFVILTLVAAVGLITLLAMLRLVLGLYDTVSGLDGPGGPGGYRDIQLLFGMVMTVLIALEFGNSILRHIREHSTIIQAREVILIGMLAVVRKVIIVDLDVVAAWQLAALGILTVSLAAAYWLMRDGA